MSKTTTVIVGVVVLLVLGGLFWMASKGSLVEPIDNRDDIVNDEDRFDMPQEEREGRIEEYIREHISELSPEPEVLGGTFYVTAIEFTGESAGRVEYEDGHIALVADFNYSIDAHGNVEVALGNVREWSGNGVVVTECFVGGCSGELCTNDPEAVSTCELLPGMECISRDVMSCEAVEGECSWVLTREAAECFAEVEERQGGGVRETRIGHLFEKADRVLGR